MIDKFLKAKHWQIFLPVVGIPLILQIVVFGTIASQFSNVAKAADPATAMMTSGIITSYALMFIVGILVFLVYYFWLYSIGVGLKKYLPSSVISRTKFFVFCLCFPVVYFLIFILIWLKMMSTVFSTNFAAAPEAMPEAFPMGIFAYMGLIIPLHLFAMFCAIYVLRFVAKITRSVELKRRARFGDYIGYFFMFWFYPIGIWFIQPKINAIVAGNRTDWDNHDSEILDA